MLRPILLADSIQLCVQGSYLRLIDFCRYFSANWHLIAPFLPEADRLRDSKFAKVPHTVYEP